MGRKSVKENKTVYQLAREELGLTREAASDVLGYISADRIEKIENEKTLARPEEVVTMAQCYKKPELCNYYCSRECPIGIGTVPELKIKDLSQITLEVLANLTALNRERDRLVEITV
ncbi:MAG: helix-turn-helix transcriptional regulator, partial [Oscillospiraceae bacterium]|nr:helix-turn-helix transcriptional regulator [Oscillospiraceae bacterium]